MNFISRGLPPNRAIRNATRAPNHQPIMAYTAVVNGPKRMVLRGTRGRAVRGATMVATNISPIKMRALVKLLSTTYCSRY